MGLLMANLLRGHSQLRGVTKGNSPMKESNEIVQTYLLDRSYLASWIAYARLCNHSAITGTLNRNTVDVLHRSRVNSTAARTEPWRYLAIIGQGLEAWLRPKGLLTTALDTG